MKRPDHEKLLESIRQQCGNEFVAVIATKDSGWFISDGERIRGEDAVRMLAFLVKTSTGAVEFFGQKLLPEDGGADALAQLIREQIEAIDRDGNVSIFKPHQN